MKTKEERVTEAIACLMLEYIGSKQYEETVATMEQYPDSFPWHKKYSSFPDSVHEAYAKERETIISANLHKSKPHYIETELKDQGLLPWLNENHKRELTEEGKRYNNLTDAQKWDETWEEESQRNNSMHKTYTLLKQLWKKHYKGLPYGDDYQSWHFGRNNKL